MKCYLSWRTDKTYACMPACRGARCLGLQSDAVPFAGSSAEARCVDAYLQKRPLLGVNLVQLDAAAGVLAAEAVSRRAPAPAAAPSPGPSAILSTLHALCSTGASSHFAATSKASRGGSLWWERTTAKGKPAISPGHVQLGRHTVSSATNTRGPRHRLPWSTETILALDFRSLRVLMTSRFCRPGKGLCRRLCKTKGLL